MELTSPPCDFCARVPCVALHRIDPRGIPAWEDDPRVGRLACGACHADLLADRDDALLRRMARTIQRGLGMAYDRAAVEAGNKLSEFRSLDTGIWEPFPLV